MINLEEAVEHFRKGEIVVYPTDTVYGVGCIANNSEAIRRLYKIKQREKGKPTHLLISSLTQAEKYTHTTDERFKLLSERFWPGALTIILAAKETVLDEITGFSDGVRTIGLRMPNHPLLVEIIEELGEPILGPSANFAGKEPPKSLNEVDKEFLKLVDFTLDEKCGGELSSTIVDITRTPHRILRNGPISTKEVDKIILDA